MIKKTSKKLIISLFAILGVVILSENPIKADYYEEFANNVAQEFANNVAHYGFNISSDFYPLISNASGIKMIEYDFDSKDGKHNTISYELFARQRDNYENYLYMYKVITSPYQNRKKGFLGFGASGNNFYNYDVITTIDFPLYQAGIAPNSHITNYYPENQPSKSTTTHGFGIGSSGISFTYNTSYNHSELDVISKTRTNERIYKTHYKRRGKTDYTKNEVISHGILAFSAKEYYAINVKHEIQYLQEYPKDKITDIGYVIIENVF